MGDKASFQVADALQQPFKDNSFDLVWSMESGEHMPDKARFVGELARVCMPGGRIIIVTWCHRSAFAPMQACLLALYHLNLPYGQQNPRCVVVENKVCIL